MSTTVTQYLTNVGSAILNRKEDFDNGPANPSTVTNTNVSGNTVAQSLTVVMLMILFFVLIVLINMYAAARLSWCYNTFYGESSALKWGYALLSAWFSHFYFPVYSIFLNPLCTLQKTGGARR